MPRQRGCYLLGRRETLPIPDSLFPIPDLMEDGVFDDTPVPQVLDDDSLEKLRRDARVPDALRVHDYDRAARTDPEARRFAALHARWAKEQIFPLEEPGEQTVKRAAATVG